MPRKEHANEKVPWGGGTRCCALCVGCHSAVEVAVLVWYTSRVGPRTLYAAIGRALSRRASSLAFRTPEVPSYWQSCRSVSHDGVRMLYAASGRARSRRASALAFRTLEVPSY